MTPSTPSRRQFLAMTGLGASLAVAGCNALQSDESDGSGGTDGGDRTATLLVQPDQQAIQTARQNATQQLQTGELNQSAAVQQYQGEYRDLAEEAIGDIEDAIGDTSVTIDDRRLDEPALLLVSGPPGAIIDLLSNESVGALTEAATFEDVSQQSSTNQTQGQ